MGFCRGISIPSRAGGVREFDGKRGIGVDGGRQYDGSVVRRYGVAVVDRFSAPDLVRGHGDLAAVARTGRLGVGWFAWARGVCSASARGLADSWRRRVTDADWKTKSGS